MNRRIDLGPSPSWTPPPPSDMRNGAQSISPEATRQPARRRSIFGRAIRGVGWLAAGPVDWIGTRRIARSWSFIRDLAATLRRGPRDDDRFKTEAGGGFDVDATAFTCGLSVAELEARLAASRKQTARIAYATFALAWMFLLGWLWSALSSPWSAARIASALNFLPFCALFFLVAFYNALLNFQIRIRRKASWREYLATAEPFWPR
ncbi:MAG: hypothetical protein J0H14_07130 [Alphaproteobacteria bacterium]|nr:hypothetical protein [Alphaproteobacteria bacterium]